MSISDNLDPRDARYFKLLEGRSAQRSGEEIARDLGFDSQQALYRQLQQDGFPLCRCGELHPSPEHTCEVQQARQRDRYGLYTGGAMLGRLQVLQLLADAWLRELLWVGITADGWKEPDEWMEPPEYRRGKYHMPLTLDGQKLRLSFAAFEEDPKGDGRPLWRTEVGDVMPRPRRAILAALAVLEGVELPKKPQQRQDALRRLGRHLEAERDNRFLTDEYHVEAGFDRLVAFVRVLLWHFRNSLDQNSDEGIELMVGTAKRVADVTESVRRLTDYLEFGKPGRDTRREVKDAKMDIYAAELHYIAGMSELEVAKKLRLKVSDRHRIKGGHDTAGKRIKRGEGLFIATLGDAGWRKYLELVRTHYQG